MLDTFISSLKEFSPKTRNHYRTSVLQFLKWAVRNDFLSSKHRLDEAEGMRLEHADIGEICFYTPNEFSLLLKNADDSMLPMIAIGGLAGLRTEELLRLDWSDVWRKKGHIELTPLIAKGRFHRIVEICPSLAKWLKPFRVNTGKVWNGNEKRFQRQFLSLCENLKMPRKENGLRHAFCTYHFALHENENKTAAQAGNSPAMIHKHYKGLATEAEAKKWFSVMPTKI